MSRTSTKRPHKLLLEHFKVGEPLTPEEVDKHTNKKGGRHSAMWNLKQLGYVIDVTKDGRTVLSYTLMKEPPNTKEIRAQFANDCKGVRAGPAKKAPVKKAPAKAPTKKAPVKKAPAKAPTKKKLKVMSVEDVKAAMANKTIPSASSFSVDPDWDALDVSVAELANIL